MRAVITGGRRGIGRALADELRERGAEVVLIDCAPEVKDTAKDIGAYGIVCDVSDERALTSAAKEALSRIGGVDVLINNAGVSLSGSFSAVSAEDFEWVMRVNFFGVVNGCRIFLPHMRSGAQIINVCSSFAWLGFPGKSAYSASKAGVRAFSESLRVELAPRGIGVTLLFPGPVDTEIVRAGRAVDPAQRAAEADFLASRAIPAKTVARRCIRAIRRNPARIVIGSDYAMIDLISRIWPSLALWLVGRLSRRMPFCFEVSRGDSK